MEGLESVEAELPGGVDAPEPVHEDYPLPERDEPDVLEEFPTRETAPVEDAEPALSTTLVERALPEEVPVTEVCRLCMEGGSLTSLFDNLNVTPVCEKVMSCAAVRVVRDDGLPEGVCSRCVKDLEVAYDFKTRCERSDTLLRERLGIKAITVVKTEIVLLDDDVVHEDEMSDRASRRTRSKKPLDDDFVAEIESDREPEEESTSDSDFVQQAEPRRRKRRSRRRHRRRRSTDEDDDDDDHPLSERKRPKKSSADRSGRYPCPHCDKSFPYPSVLKLHSVTHTKEKTHKCILCPEAFHYSKALYAHYKEAHPFESMPKQRTAMDTPNETFPCGLCDKVFGQAKNLKVHEAMHAREKKYKCDGCDAGFTNMTVLNTHKKSEHPYMFRRLSCQYCNRNFKKQASLDRHLEHHRLGENGKGGGVDSKKPPLTKDLFKSIAPITTTYWSDSFSD